MKKLFLIFTILFFSILSASASTCDNYDDKSKREYNNWMNARYDNPSKNSYYNNYKKYREKYEKCYKSYENAFNNWYSSYNRWDYLSAIKYYKQAWNLYWMEGSTKNNLWLAYISLAGWYFDKKEFKNSIKYYKEAEKIWYDNKYLIYSNIWASYSNLYDNRNALIYYKKAKNITFDSIKIKEISKRIKWIEKLQLEEKEKKNAVSNDYYSYKQYYIKKLKIRKTQKSFFKNKQVIIAVIDDWIHINHPDLSDNVWINEKEIPWNLKDDDNNWYIDDYSGVNFVKSDLWFVSNIIPAWTHWTKVAWIIGASINNNEWIMWIVKNVKIMNLRAFPLNWKWANDKDILKAINYAIDNGANIINLSLASSNNLITINNPEYNKIFEKAYNKWVIIVVAAWNWDILSKQTEWVNTKINPVYPICSENYYKHIIWVWAHDKEWYRARWSNYEKCVDFYAPWVDIISTFFNKDWNWYNIDTWTSFSAPMVSGIIWLWFNKYWKINNDLVYDALNYSLEKNSVWNYEINTEKYLLELWKLKNREEEKEKIYKENLELKNKAKSILVVLNNSTKNYNERRKVKLYNNYIALLSKYSLKLKKTDKKIMIDFLIELLKNEIK